MQALSYAQIEEATKVGPEAVAAMLCAAGVEIAGLPKDLRRKLRGEPETPPAKDLPATPTIAKRSAP